MCKADYKMFCSKNSNSWTISNNFAVTNLCMTDNEFFRNSKKDKYKHFAKKSFSLFRGIQWGDYKHTIIFFDKIWFFFYDFFFIISRFITQHFLYYYVCDCLLLIILKSALPTSGKNRHTNTDIANYRNGWNGCLLFALSVTARRRWGLPSIWCRLHRTFSAPY